MSDDVDRFVTGYVAARAGAADGVDRLVTESCGLDAAGMLSALADPRIGSLGVGLMADLMAPAGSLYYDAIYGAFHGQAAIRGWLVPTMASIDFIEFRPTAAPVLFDDGAGGTSLDEWRMVARFGDDELPLSRGVSVRRYRDGWITWACDVYDTGPFRVPPPADAPEVAVDAPPLPPWPRVDWPTVAAAPAEDLDPATGRWVAARRAVHADGGAGPVTTPSGLSPAQLHAVVQHPSTGYDMGLFADLCHPTDSVYLDPIFGEVRGQAAIRAWLTDVMGKVGAIVFDPVGPVLFDGATSVQEWVQVAVQPDGRRVPMTRGTSVRRYADGWLVYAADYFDTAPFADPDIQAAGVAAGSTLTPADIARHRTV